ncbi:phosphoglycerate mutase family protein [Tenacibaculum sp. HL-MS23]|uniref:SixA phosphatase family protein n=1 Tax=Tenacibaculum sp. HL-MS23 TaxID=3077734 RepID=UPI0028FC21E3|nr:phosphoglycerate mutase family protein [Tenacibaculum sp. HL-MS23]WNW02360.1 phosphoglycerate mutase family protein [Tenacibaculum sp. HL-MS23]
MKKYLLIFTATLGLLSSCALEETNTTYYLIRHAEKDRTDKSNKNPNLNKKGKERAKKWSEYFKDINLNAVYSTNYNRTIQTAKPTADSKKLDIINYDPSNMFSKDFEKETTGKTVLIVGHSNTTPQFANKIIKSEVYESMDDNDNASLFIISLKKSFRNKTTSIKKITVD